ncbi:MAG TPA: hypothetical protein VHI54_07180 [Actinomycetota bacterium]|nr:hypothetical protein [Actinomycetota bacterium]
MRSRQRACERSTLLGHTSGHVSYLWPEHDSVLFVGDAAANNFSRLNFGYSCEDMDAANRSFRKLAELISRWLRSVTV